MGAVPIQVFVTLLLSVFVFINSSGIVWPSYALKMLESDDSPLGYPITKSDGNLIGSIVMLGSLTSILGVGYVNETIGRKRTGILTALCFTLGWSIIATAKNVTQLVIGRFVFGLAGGMQIVTGYIFVSEISQLSLRGTLLTLLSFSYNIGALVSYIEGWFCSYTLINYINLSVAVAMVILLSFIKETPSYLLKIGKEKEALLSLKFYRGTTDVTQEILDEFAYIRSQQRVSSNKITEFTNTSLLENQNVKENFTLKETIQEEHAIAGQSPWKILLTSKSSQRAFVLMSTQMIIAVFVGLIGIQAYAGQMFRRAAPNISPDLCSVLLAIVMAISGGAAIVVTDMIPRRVLMISSSLMSAVSMALLASLLRWSWAPEWSIPLAIVLYCIFFQIGVINVPFVQVAEYVPPQLKSLGTTVGMFSMFLANFFVLFMFEPAVSVFGLEGVFFLFAIVGLVAAIVSFLFMRETKKVPFEVIQEAFEIGYLYRRQNDIKTIVTT